MSDITSRLSLAAILISLLAIAISILQYRDTHAQLLLSMKPSVQFMNDDDPDELPVGISIDNAGPGPATIKSIEFYVDKKPVGPAEKAVDFLNLGNVHYLELDEGDTLAVGAREWLLRYDRKPRNKEDQKDLNDFLEVLNHRVAVQVEFCPVMNGECGKKCSTPHWCE